MNIVKCSLVVLVIGVFVPQTAWSQTQAPFKNFSSTLQKLGFSNVFDIKKPAPVSRLKVAVLDKGFLGLSDALGKSLPRSTVYHAGVNVPEQQTAHGRVMAEILFQALTNQGRDQRFYPSEFHLYNVYGFTNFKSAIDDIIARDIDVVLYSEVWEIGGNWDGKGFINNEVNRATSHGVIWVNAAGNFANRTYQSAINSDDEGWVYLPDRNNAIQINCKPSFGEKSTCSFAATLTWNDFKDKDGIGTNKDLDFALYDEFLNLVERSTLDQVVDFSSEDAVGQTQYPREAVSAQLKKGSYFLKVRNRSRNFSADDQFRITVDGEFVDVPSGQIENSLLNPADNATVITVGASDSDLSSQSKKLAKPDILAPSSIVLSANDKEFRGSSNSAAIVGAGVCLYKMLNNSADAETVLKSLSRPRRPSQNQYQQRQSIGIHQRGYDSRVATEARMRSSSDSVEFRDFYISFSF